MRSSVHRQRLLRSPAQPHGQGFIAATIWKRAGYCTLRAARAMRMWPDSSGSRKVSSALRFHSGNSSRNSTPWWASDISPGQGGLPLSLPADDWNYRAQRAG